MKKAFTIPELLIIIALVGIISVTMITIIKPNEKTFPYLYYNAYNTLRIAMKNINLDAQYASESMPETSQDLCKKLAVNRNDPNSDYGYINTTKYNCDSFYNISDPSSIGENHIAFQASNSMLYYISQHSTQQIYNKIQGSYNEYGYYVIWVDLNGYKKPNSAKFTKKLPDIVPFIVTEKGDVIPIGIPSKNKNYMTANVEISDPDRGNKFSGIMTYYEAVRSAYGLNSYPDSDLSSAFATWDNKISSNYNITIDTSDQPLSQCAVDDGKIPPCTPRVIEMVAGF